MTDERLEALESTVKAMRARTIKIARGAVELGRAFDDRLEDLESLAPENTFGLDLPALYNQVTALEATVHALHSAQAEHLARVKGVWAQDDKIEDWSQGIDARMQEAEQRITQGNDRVSKLAKRFMDRLQEAVQDTDAVEERLDDVIECTDVELSNRLRKLEERAEKFEFVQAKQDHDLGEARTHYENLWDSIEAQGERIDKLENLYKRDATLEIHERLDKLEDTAKMPDWNAPEIERIEALETTLAKHDHDLSKAYTDCQNLYEGDAAATIRMDGLHRRILRIENADLESTLNEVCEATDKRFAGVEADWEIRRMEMDDRVKALESLPRSSKEIATDVFLGDFGKRLDALEKAVERTNTRVDPLGDQEHLALLARARIMPREDD